MERVAALLLLSVLHVAAGLDGAVPLEECKRECDGQPKTCYLKLHIERYSVLGPACRGCEDGKEEDCLRPQCVTADGFQRSIITANRALPSPAIEVCRGDRVVVDVVNQMPDETTSLHWHGLSQAGTQYQDGVPYVTQCPVLPATIFRYNFTADEAGTFFYHSHTGLQKADGLAGALIVREEKGKDVHAELYDEDDHVVLIGDWTHVPAEHLVPGLHSSVTQSPITYLVNGRGAFYDPSRGVELPMAEFEVEAGRRYRFRLIASTCLACGVAVRIEGHNLTAISADGGLPFDPVQVHTVLMNPADRFDVVLNADQPEGVYFMRLEGVGPSCGHITQQAILRYKNAASGLHLSSSNPNYGIVLNDITSKCDGLSESELCISHLHGFSDAPKIANLDMYHQLELGFNFYFADEDAMFSEGTYVSYDEPVKGLYAKPLINKISFSPPPSPLISQLDDIPAESYCNEQCKAGNVSTCCVCANVIDIKLNSTVDIIITDEDSLFAHPFHLHGYNFYVLEMKGGFRNLKKEVAELKERLRRDEVETEGKPQRDTISVPFGGYVAIRFVANNPGFWILHCHFAFHLEGGMAAVLKVGEISDLPPVPRNFPRCGNFL